MNWTGSIAALILDESGGSDTSDQENVINVHKEKLFLRNRYNVMDISDQT